MRRGRRALASMRGRMRRRCEIRGGARHRAGTAVRMSVALVSRSASDARRFERSSTSGAPDFLLVGWRPHDARRHQIHHQANSTKSCTSALEAGVGQCVNARHYEVTLEHVMLALLDNANCDIAFLVPMHYDLDPARPPRRAPAQPGRPARRATPGRPDVLADDAGGCRTRTRSDPVELRLPEGPQRRALPALLAQHADQVLGEQDRRVSRGASRRTISRPTSTRSSPAPRRTRRAGGGGGHRRGREDIPGGMASAGGRIRRWRSSASTTRARRAGQDRPDVRSRAGDPPADGDPGPPAQEQPDHRRRRRRRQDGARRGPRAAAIVENDGAAAAAGRRACSSSTWASCRPAPA